MKSPLHILHLEDDPNDAALIQLTLQSGGIACTTTCVQNHDDFIAALEHNRIDLILSDSVLPASEALASADILHKQWPAIPLILVSGSMVEELAIDSLQRGATDYVAKQHLSRLVPAVRRAMQEVEVRAKNRRSEEAFQIVFNQSVLGMALVGVDGRPNLTNPALQKMLGYTGTELSQRPFQECTHPDDFARNVDLYQQLIRGESKNYQMENRYIRKDGRVVWARLSMSVAPEAEGGDEFAIAVVQDMTERRQLETQCIESQKVDVLGQLAIGLTHDFNNILAVIMGYSDLTIQKLCADKLLQGHLKTIQSAARRGARLIQQLLVFSRKQTEQLNVLDLNDVVADVAKMLRRLISENIEMTIVPGKHIGRVKADSGYVGLLLMNLVVNARDAMPNGGKVIIATSNVTLNENHTRAHPGAIPGDYVMLSVTDTGTGMTDEVKAHLFEAFFTTKPSGRGTGLGLANCHTIVQKSGGHIEVYSEIGKGTAFKIYFPRVEQPFDAAARALEAGSSPRGTETLLVVEDDPFVRHLVCGILKALGYEVLSATNGQDALRTVHQHKGSPIRLAFTDVIMPLVGGKAMAEWLKGAYPGVKILFTSGYPDDVIAHQGLESGVEFLPKPYTAAMLARKVREMLDLPGTPASETVQQTFTFTKLHMGRTPHGGRNAFRSIVVPCRTVTSPK